MSAKQPRSVGIISDTHGLLRPEAADALSGVDLILHAGDIGKPSVLEELGRIAPVTAIRGNVDKGEWAEHLPERRVLAVGDVSIYMLHDPKELDIDPAIEGINVIVCGHSHKPVIRKQDGVLYLNPGSAGPRRFSLPVCLAILKVERGSAEARIIDLI